jgi:hypothetical protein
VDLISVNRPAIEFYPGAELKNDPTNWCDPNIPALEAMLRLVGFKRIELIASSPLDPKFPVDNVYEGWVNLHAWF